MSDTDDEMTEDEKREEAEQVAYIKRLIELERAGERTTIKIGPFSALTLIGMLQLVTRNSGLTARQRDIARDIARQMEPLFTGTEGEEIVRRGGHPEWDK